MNKKEILARLQSRPGRLPTLEEVDFIIQDNREDILKLSKNMLVQADEAHAHGEKYIDTAASEKFFQLEQSLREGNAELWKHQNATEIEWLKVRESIVSGTNSDPGKFYTALLELQDESQMTKH